VRGAAFGDAGRVGPFGARTPRKTTGTARGGSALYCARAGKRGKLARRRQFCCLTRSRTHRRSHPRRTPSLAAPGGLAKTTCVSSELRGMGGTRFQWRTLLCLAVALAGAADARAGEVTPVELTMLGPNAVSVRVAQGTTQPCDSGDNRMLVRGKFAPGAIVRATSPDACVCVQQTYDSFPDIDWAPGAIVCRPQICQGVGRARRCFPAPDPTIRIGIRSARGG